MNGRSRRSTVPKARPPKRPDSPLPPRRAPTPPPPRSRQIARILDDSDSSLLDVLDNLLNRGVVLNAEVILALADVDLIYLRLSALLCAADRVFSDEPGK